MEVVPCQLVETSTFLGVCLCEGKLLSVPMSDIPEDGGFVCSDVCSILLVSLVPDPPSVRICSGEGVGTPTVSLAG